MNKQPSRLPAPSLSSHPTTILTASFTNNKEIKIAEQQHGFTPITGSGNTKESMESEEPEGSGDLERSREPESSGEPEGSGPRKRGRPRKYPLIEKIRPDGSTRMTVLKPARKKQKLYQQQQPSAILASSCLLTTTTTPTTTEFNMIYSQYPSNSDNMVEENITFSQNAQ